VTGRRQYPQHAGDPVDRFLTERCNHGGAFQVDELTRLCAELGHPEWVPLDGNNGSKRMAVGRAMRRAFPDNVIRFANGSLIALEDSRIDRPRR
jgi:hypothetical protein